MAFLRSRTGGQYSLVFCWKGKKVIRALGTKDRREAEQIKKDAEEQLARITQGDSRPASRLLTEGVSIVEVLFGSPEIAARLDWESDHNPLTVAELCEGYLNHLKPNVGFDQSYNTESWLKRIRKVLGNDRRVMSLASSDAEHIARLRAKSVGNPTVKKEIGSLKAAVSWAVDEGLLKSNPIKRWPKIKVKRQKPFMWKSEIEAQECPAPFPFVSQQDRQTIQRQRPYTEVFVAAGSFRIRRQDLSQFQAFLRHRFAPQRRAATRCSIVGSSSRCKNDAANLRSSHDGRSQKRRESEDRVMFVLLIKILIFLLVGYWLFGGSDDDS